jgi:acetyl esterase/lipase
MGNALKKGSGWQGTFTAKALAHVDTGRHHHMSADRFAARLCRHFVEYGKIRGNLRVAKQRVPVALSAKATRWTSATLCQAFCMPFTLDSIQDLETVMQRRTAAAESASASYVCQRLIAYGPDPDQTLDYYPARASDGPTPLVLFIHGGFWRSMRAAQFSFLARGFVDQGISLVVIDYPLIPRVRMEQVVHSWPMFSRIRATWASMRIA